MWVWSPLKKDQSEPCPSVSLSSRPRKVTAANLLFLQDLWGKKSKFYFTISVHYRGNLRPKLYDYPPQALTCRHKRENMQWALTCDRLPSKLWCMQTSKFAICCPSLTPSLHLAFLSLQLGSPLFFLSLSIHFLTSKSVTFFHHNNLVKVFLCSSSPTSVHLTGRDHP